MPGVGCYCSEFFLDWVPSRQIPASNPDRIDNTPKNYAKHGTGRSAVSSKAMSQMPHIPVKVDVKNCNVLKMIRDWLAVGSKDDLKIVLVSRFEPPDFPAVV